MKRTSLASRDAGDTRPFDLRAEIRFKNGLLFRSLDELLGPGWSQKKAAAYLGVYPTEFSNLIRLKVSPKTFQDSFRHEGIRWRIPVVRIAERLGYTPEELFPESLYALNLPECVVREFQSPEVLSLQEASAQLLLPAVDFEAAEMTKILGEEQLAGIESALRTLTPREEKVIRLRFGIGCEREHTLKEIGQELGVCKGHAQQIEAKAIRKLRSIDRKRTLRLLLAGPRRLT